MGSRKIGRKERKILHKITGNRRTFTSEESKELKENILKLFEYGEVTLFGHLKRLEK